MKIALISHPDCLLHQMGQDHPESPARLHAIEDQLVASGLDEVLYPYDAPQASRGQLQRVHEVAYVQSIYDAAPEEGMVALDPDTWMNPYSLRAALRAAGAAVLGVDLVMSGEMDAAFCSIRPPGHHAERDRAMGFCLFNNIAVGTAHALAKHGLQRVAIVDFDVHHGNGTEDIFRDEPRVLLCSSFEHPFYPYSGADTVSDHIVNVPLPPGSSGRRFRGEVEAKWLPALEAFSPQLVMISAGFDAHHEDEMAHLNLNERDYSWVTRQIKDIADAYANGRIVSLLEGGYALDALGHSVVAHLEALQGTESPP